MPAALFAALIFRYELMLIFSAAHDAATLMLLRDIFADARQ